MITKSPDYVFGMWLYKVLNIKGLLEKEQILLRLETLDVAVEDAHLSTINLPHQGMNANGLYAAVDGFTTLFLWVQLTINGHC